MHLRDAKPRTGPGRWLVLPAALLLAATVSACDEEQVEVAERIRAIKTITVAERASGQLRKFSGVVEAVDTSALSFEVAGNVQKLNAEVGDKITRGQVMAVMDEKTFRLNVESAEADLGRTRAEQAEKKTEFDRQDALFKKGWEPGRPRNRPSRLTSPPRTRSATRSRRSTSPSGTWRRPS